MKNKEMRYFKIWWTYGADEWAEDEEPESYETVYEGTDEDDAVGKFKEYHKGESIEILSVEEQEG